MSVRATNHVRRLRGLNFAEGRSAFVLADHANHKTGEITISMQTLKEECELAFRQTASDIVGRLIEWKVFLAPHPSKGRKPTTLYVNYDLGNCDSPITVAPLRNRNSPDAVNRNSRDAVTQTQPQPESPSSTLQPQSEMVSTAIPGLHKGFMKGKERKDAAPASPSPLVTRRASVIEEFSEETYLALLEFEKYRKKIRKPLTEHAIELTLKELAELCRQGNDPVEVLEQSIRNGWQGIFPVKGSRNGKQESFEERRQRKSAEALGEVRRRAGEVLREVDATPRLESGNKSADRSLRRSTD
jgi:hypothetical protein